MNEVLISTHVCHPSLANDNLSGIALATVPGQASEQSFVKILLSVSFYAWDYRFHYLAESE